MHNVSVNYCVTCRDKGIKKEIIVNQYSPSDICNDCKPKSIDAKSVIDEIKTNAVVKNEAVNLLKKIRFISGINSRKLVESMNVVRDEFGYINKLIDDFVKNNNIKNFKK